MRRLLSFAAFLLIVSLVPVCAQRGGRSAGGHGGFGGARGGLGGHGGFAGHGFASHGFGGSRPGGSHFTGSHFAPGMRTGFRGDRFRGDHFRDRDFDHHFRHRCFGCFAFGYPYYAYDPYWDYWWWDSHSSYDEDAARERELANEMNADNLQEQQMLREQDQDLYAPHAAAQPRAEEHAQNDPPTVLVFRDRHQREIQNYAIVGSMLWSFTPQRTEKIPLAELDISATVKANDDRGVEFNVPGSNGEQRIEKLWIQPAPSS